MKKVSVSFFNHNDNIEDTLMKVCSTDVDYIHVDVGDGSFIERKFNPIKELIGLNSVLSKRFDVHFMVDSPLEYIDKYSVLNCEYMTIHCEIKKDILSLLNHIKAFGIKCGIAISPDTDLSFIEPFLDDIDMILIMSVVPGKSGQSFIYNSVDRVKEIRSMIKDRNIVINIDGGINNETASLVDTDIVVSESYILNGDYQDRINMLR